MKKIIVISGPSGVGKTTLYKRLLEDFKDKLAFSISATTRPPRETEKNGYDYFFIEKEKFDKLIEEGAFIEWAKVYNHYYGTLKSELERISKEGKWCLLDVDVQGGLNIKKIYPESKLIFIEPPSLEELERRITKRSLDRKKDIKKRLNTAIKEMNYKKFYDYNIINDDLENCYKKLKEIVFHIISENL